MGIKTDFLRVSGTTRTNLKILDRGSRLTELNEPGLQVIPEEIRAMTEKIKNLTHHGVVFILSGSLPNGIDANYYAELIYVIHKNGGLAYLDADGEAFKAAIEEKPDLVKPNSHELTEYFGVENTLNFHGLEDLCLQVRKKGIGKVVLSLGSKGAMFVNTTTMVAPALKVKAHSSVGAGDSMMAALAYGAEKGLGWDETSALAMAVSAGAVTTTGTKPPDRTLVDTLLKQVCLKTLSTIQEEIQ
jgi:1-phosphofructokinase